MKHLKAIEALPCVDGEPPMGETLELMSKAERKLSIPRTSAFNREDVVRAFTDSFELIGGVPRLATWAHSHQTEFYRLYAKLLPSSAQKQITHDGKVIIEHALQPGPLDGKTIEHNG